MKIRLRIISALSPLLVVAPVARAQTRLPAEEGNSKWGQLQENRESIADLVKGQEGFDASEVLTGEWGGRRSRLQEQGIKLGFAYTGEYGKVTEGGVQQKESFLENLNIEVSADLEKLWGFKGWSFYVYGLDNRGVDGKKVPSLFVGDKQVTSNIEAKTDDFHLFGLSLQKTWNGGASSVLAGLYNLNSEFYVTDASGLFLNASFGIGQEMAQTGVQGPSIFPYASAGVRIGDRHGKSLGENRHWRMDLYSEL